MKLRQRIRAAAVASSLIILTAVLVEWLRANCYEDLVDLDITAPSTTGHQNGWYFGVDSYHDRMRFGVQVIRDDSPPDEGPVPERRVTWSHRFDRRLVAGQEHFPGSEDIGLNIEVWNQGDSERCDFGWLIPYWLLAVAFGLWPSLIALRVTTRIWHGRRPGAATGPGHRPWSSPEPDSSRSVFTRATHGITCLSLVLCAFLSALWWRADSHVDKYTFIRHGLCTGNYNNGWTLLQSDSKGLRLVILLDKDWTPLEDQDHWAVKGYTVAHMVALDAGWDDDSHAERFAFAHEHSRTATTARTDLAVLVPHGAAVAASAVWPLCAGLLLLAKRYRTSRRRREGRCLTCGYDLRGSPDRCPECGAARNAANPPGGSRAVGN